MNLADFLMPHLVVVPILLPMFTAALLVAVREKHRATRSAINVLSCLVGVLVAALLLTWIKERDTPSAFALYLPANWDMPFGIALAADRFSAMMLLVASVVGLAAAIFAVARWDRAGVHFQTLFQVQLMGINGAFLTADLFNLFVFFEILLAASYGLVLHGSGPARVKAGLHYITINLVASSLFLIGVALIYGMLGSLNMADIAQKIRWVAPGDHGLLFAGFAILAVAFLAKAAVWPLNFWLVPAYASASAPAGAVFALLTKVGLYVILRLSTLFFSGEAGPDEAWGNDWLIYGGMATLAVGACGVLSAMRPARLAAYSTLVSSGTLLAAIGFGQVSLTTAALYYLPASTLAIATFFLIAELMERARSPEADNERAPEDEEDHLPFNLADLDLVESEHANLDERQEAVIGRAIPAATAFLGLAFACCALLLAGLPPLAGFIGKFAMFNELLNPYGTASSSAVDPGLLRWTMLALVIISGLFALIGFSRTGMRVFWAPSSREAPRLRVVECVPIVILLALCVLITLRAEVMLRYTRAAAMALYTPGDYIGAVLSAQPKAAPTNRARLALPAPPPEARP